MSKKPVVVVTRKLPEAVEARLARDYQARFNQADRLYDSQELLALTEGADAVLPCHTEHLSEAVIGALPKSVRVIANMSVGVDHVDLEAAKNRGIVVTNTPDVLSDATAEIVMLLMLGAARRASEGERLVRTSEWRDWSPAFMVGIQVTGKRLGVERFHSFGVVNELTKPGEALSTALAAAEQLAAGPARALTRIKQLTDLGQANSLQDQLDCEAEMMSHSLSDAEAAEGTSAFLEKRPPDFEKLR